MRVFRRGQRAYTGESDHSTTKSLYGKDPDGLEWFILGANRPVDPVVSGGALGVASLVLYRVTG